jgi:hypothetical protein
VTSFFVALLAASVRIILSDTSPGGVPAGDALLNWERYGGQADTAYETVAYELWVDPKWPGFYTITRFRSRALERGAEDKPEILVWNAHPGERVPLLCYERVQRGSTWVWDAVEPGTKRYRQEMVRAIQVYGLHRTTSLGLGPFGGP